MSKRRSSKAAPAKRGMRPRILVLEGLSGARAAVRDAGGVAVVVSPRDVKACDRALSGGAWDALLLTGGSDVDPRLYGQKPAKRTYGVNQTRDTVELVALSAARRRSVPVLGICRGAQMMAVEAGGELRQHIDGHSGGRHFVRSSGTLAKAAGLDPFVCISLHHQEVKRLPRGWEVMGWAPDGTVEAIGNRNGRCLGVQFHPEMDDDSDYARGIFRWLVLEAARRAGLPTPRRPQRRPARPRYGSYRGQASLWDRDWLDDDDELDQLLQPTPKPAHQPARSRTAAPVTVSWVCPRCGIVFENLKDREDHVHQLHR